MNTPQAGSTPENKKNKSSHSLNDISYQRNISAASRNRQPRFNEYKHILYIRFCVFLAGENVYNTSRFLKSRQQHDIKTIWNVIGDDQIYQTGGGRKKNVILNDYWNSTLNSPTTVVNSSITFIYFENNFT